MFVSIILFNDYSINQRNPHFNMYHSARKRRLAKFAYETGHSVLFSTHADPRREALKTIFAYETGHSVLFSTHTDPRRETLKTIFAY